MSVRWCRPAASGHRYCTPEATGTPRIGLKVREGVSDTESTMSDLRTSPRSSRAAAAPTGRGPVAALFVALLATVLAACAPASSESDPTAAARQGSDRANRIAGPPPTTPSSPAPTPAPGTYVTPGARLGIGGCPVFPTDNVFHASIGALPVRAGSAETIQALGSSRVIQPGFGSGVWMGSRPGIPTNVVDATTSAHEDLLVSLEYASLSETADMPWPATPRFEGWPGRAWDKHLLVVDSSTCSSWEAINVQPPGENYFATLFNRWYADKVVRLDLTTNAIAPRGTVTASGLSMLAGMVRYDEVATGRIDHVLTMVSPVIRRGPSVWPASGSDGQSLDPSAPPMGTWLRLRSDVDISHLGPQARTVAQAMKDHGVVINDTGPFTSINGEPDVRWNDADLAGLKTLTAGQFEVVDPTPMQVDPGTHQIR